MCKVKTTKCLYFSFSVYTIEDKKWGEQRLEQKTPLEINDHLKIFGKNADEVDSIGPYPFVVHV